MSEHNLRNRHARDRETNWGVAPEAVQPRADASAWPVIGIDVSHHQGEVNFLSAKEAGYTFVFLKATEGSTFVDPRFASNRERAAAAGMLVGAYHFFRPKSDATAQALHFVRTVGSLRNRELPPVIDIEDNRLWEGITSDAAMKMVQRFCDVVRRDLGVEPIIYCSPSFVRDVLKHNAALAHFVLWLAHYTQAQQPNVPAPWTRWTFWQHSETGRVPGVSTNCDLNRFNGTPEQLAAMARRFTTALPLTTSVYHWWLWLLMRFRF